MSDISSAVFIIGIIIVGLWISNILYDCEIKNYVSRKIGHGVGGFAYLLSIFLFTNPWWPLALSIGFTLMLAGARVIRPQTFRGIGGSARQVAYAEIWFPLAGTISIAIGWIWLGQPMIAVGCILMMAFGDLVTGIVRSQVYSREVKGMWGSAAMLVVCLVLGWVFISPVWLGAIVAVGATLTEYLCGGVGRIKWLDDNLAIPLVSLVISLGGLALLGML